MKKATLYRIFSNIPELETERLLLRKMSQSDAEDMFEYAKEADLTKYLTWYPHPSLEYTKEYLGYIVTRYKAGDFFDWAVTLKETGKMIGSCGFTRFDTANDSAELGYVINPDYKGRGIATEALLAVLQFGFESLLLNRAESKFIEGNDASRRVMEKAGMRYEGMGRQSMKIKGEYKNIGVCGILRDEFFSM